MKKVLVWVGIALAVLILIQLVPYGRNHTNPAVLAEPKWDSPTTRELTKRACFDCHSNETKWPWYSNIAPVSWLNQRDVDEGRSRLNFSEWGVVTTGEGEGRDAMFEIQQVIESGEMPMPIYVIMHPTAKLSTTEKQQLIDGLLVTTGQK